MRRSTDRILTTHTGSLPRPADLVELLRKSDAGEPVDERLFDSAVRAAVGEAVGKQLGAGIAVINDGEQGKPGYATEVLRDRARVRLGRLEWEIEILPSGPEVARALGITSGVLVVASRATAYSRDGVPVSRSERCYRIDRVKFHVAAQDPPDAGGEKRMSGTRAPRRTDTVR